MIYLRWTYFSINITLCVLEKSGVEPEEILNIATHIREKCENLQLEGLMTIGKFGYNPADGPNPDFLCLRECRDKLAKSLNINSKDLQLSMGMSTDFEQAVSINIVDTTVLSNHFDFYKTFPYTKVHV